MGLDNKFILKKGYGIAPVINQKHKRNKKNEFQKAISSFLVKNSNTATIKFEKESKNDRLPPLLTLTDQTDWRILASSDVDETYHS